MSVKRESMLALRWQAIDGLAERIKRHLRPLYVVLDFCGVAPDNPWLAALAWVKGVLPNSNACRTPAFRCPKPTLTQRLRPYLLTFDADGSQWAYMPTAYEFWLYRQLRKRLQSGEIYLTTACNTAASPMNSSLLRKRLTCSARWTFLAASANRRSTRHADGRIARAVASVQPRVELGKAEASRLRQRTKQLSLHRPKADNDAAHDDAFYEQLSFCDVPTCSAL